MKLCVCEICASELYLCVCVYICDGLCVYSVWCLRSVCIYLCSVYMGGVYMSGVCVSVCSLCVCAYEKLNS